MLRRAHISRETPPMLYELRIYEILPGRMDAIMNRFSQHTMRIFERLDIEVVGFWQEVVGRSDRLVYITRFESQADREAKWTAFQSDPEWQRVRAETEASGQIVSRVINSYMTPTGFSPMQ